MISLDSKELAKQLGVPEDLLKAYVDARLAHVASGGEKAGGLGLHGEELAAFGIMGFLIMQTKAPFKEAAKVMEQTKRVLGQSFHPDLRVVVIAVTKNRGKRCVVQVGEIPKDHKCEMKDGKHKDHMTVIDARELRDRMDEAIWKEPLKLPKVAECVVPY